MNKRMVLALGVASFLTSFVVAKVIADFRYLLTFSDGDCTSIGGSVEAHKKMRVKDAEGNFMLVTVTRCKVPVSEARSLRPEQETPSMVISQMPNLKGFAKILRVAGAGTTIDRAEDLTLWAPSDKALDKLPAETLAILMKEKDAAQQFVNRHLVSGKRIAFDLTPARKGGKTDEPITGSDGMSRKIVATSDRVSIAGSKLFAADIETSNGVIHIIDSVLPER